jgi:hypothetical protein
MIDFKEEPENMGKEIITFLFGIVAVCYMIYVLTK